MQAEKVKVDFINTRKKIYAANAMANEQSLRNAIACLTKRVKKCFGLLPGLPRTVSGINGDFRTKSPIFPTPVYI